MSADKVIEVDFDPTPFDASHSVHLSPDEPLLAFVTRPRKGLANRLRRLFGMDEQEEVFAVLDLRNPDAHWEGSETYAVSFDADGTFRIT